MNDQAQRSTRQPTPQHVAAQLEFLAAAAETAEPADSADTTIRPNFPGSGEKPARHVQTSLSRTH